MSSPMAPCKVELRRIVKANYLVPEFHSPSLVSNVNYGATAYATRLAVRPRTSARHSSEPNSNLVTFLTWGAIQIRMLAHPPCDTSGQARATKRNALKVPAGTV